MIAGSSCVSTRCSELLELFGRLHDCIWSSASHARVRHRDRTRGMDTYLFAEPRRVSMETRKMPLLQSHQRQRSVSHQDHDETVWHRSRGRVGFTVVVGHGSLGDAFTCCGSAGRALQLRLWF